MPAGCHLGTSTEAEFAALATALAAVRRSPAGTDCVTVRCQGKPARATSDCLFQTDLDQIATTIADGHDPLGDALCALRSAAERRRQGIVYTPQAIVDAMVGWAAAQQPAPARIVDAGAGSGRFLLAAAGKFPHAQLLAAECDPLAVLALHANANVAGFAHRLHIHEDDYRRLTLPEVDGPTLFLGNPPYVRHHDIPAVWKRWLTATAARWGIAASQLAGLHVHFLFQTCRLVRPGDYGTLITAAEWLDVNYGAAMRSAFVDVLGGTSVDVVAPTAKPFPNATTTGAIIRFRVGGGSPAMRFRAVRSTAEIGKRRGGRSVPRSAVRRAKRWSPFLRPAAAAAPCNHIQLGELCRVHRGQVTGRNAVWIAGGYRGPLPAASLVPTVTRAKEILAAGERITKADLLRRVIDLPVDLDELDSEARRQVAAFLRWAKGMAADASYIARHRRAWWAVGLRDPAPILCTYMARRPPAFVTNACDARHLNIAHGLYPREALPAKTLDALATWLRSNVQTTSGRTYAGGLTKFEPKELERIRIPPPEELRDRAADLGRGRTHRCRKSNAAYLRRTQGRRREGVGGRGGMASARARQVHSSR